MSDAIIHTERCLLRPWSADQLDPLYDLMMSLHVRRYLLDGRVMSRDWMAQEVADSEGRFADGSVGLWLAWSQADPAQVVGLTGFRPFYDPPRIQIVYALNEAVLGHGLATEIASAAMQWAIRSGRLECVECSVDAPNTASVRLARRLGFEETHRDATGAAGETIHFRYPPTR